jgi:hypothetical protein
MTEMRHSSAAEDAETGFEPHPMTGWVGWIVFAGVIMVISGAFDVIAGLVALFKDNYYLVRSDGLVVNVDYTAWGWVHLLLGVVLAAVGIGAMAGQTWARVVGVVIVSLNAIVQFAFLAAYPFWSTILIALNIFVIYALVVHGREARELR